MSKKMIAIIASLLVVFGAVTYIVGGMVYDGTVGDVPFVEAEAMPVFYAEDEQNVLNQLENYESESKMIKSDQNGYEIETLSIKSPTPSDDVMVVVHGITSNYFEILSTAFNYLERGYNVVVYHQRQTGATGGDDFTFGLYERFDLDAVVNYANELYPNGTLGVHGFSMGAATSAMHTALNEEQKLVDFYILDGPYHTMESAVELGIVAEDVPLIPVSYALWAGNLTIKAKAGFGFDDIKPIDAVAKASVPVMLIHGTADAVTSPKSSQLMFDVIKHDNKTLWMIDGSGHCKASEEIPDEYFTNVMKFINTYVK